MLTLAALAGAACIVLTILAFAGGYSLILFKTGSMSPTIPAGSVALVQRIPAADVHVGDIITVDREGKLPITHRVTDIRGGTSPAERVITMRGDANASDDPMPYDVNEVRIVRGAVPYLAPVIVLFGNPWVLGGLTLGAGLLVTWAFWPRRAPHQDDEPASANEEQPGDDARKTTAEPPLSVRTIVVFVAAAAALSTGAVLTPAPAAAAPPAFLVIHSDLAHAGVQELDPVDPLHWHLDIDASRAPEGGELVVAFSSTGDAGFGLRTEVRSCAVPWSANDSCDKGERLLRPWEPLFPDGDRHGLWTAPTPAAVHLRIALTAQPSDPAAGATGASVTVRATAAGETVDSGIQGQPELPPTGGTPLTLLAAPAAVLVGIGAAMLARKRRAGRKST